MAVAGLPARVPTIVRVGAAIAAVGSGYHFSLSVLASDWRHDTPLAHLILVPPLAAVLLVGACLRYRHVASFGLSRFDLLVAAVFFLVPLVVVAVGPVIWSKYFWAMRLDLLTLPLFASATIVLLFGLRALVPLAFPLVYLLLAWPLPYLAVLEHLLGVFTESDDDRGRDDLGHDRNRYARTRFRPIALPDRSRRSPDGRQRRQRLFRRQ